MNFENNKLIYVGLALVVGVGVGIIAYNNLASRSSNFSAQTEQLTQKDVENNDVRGIAEQEIKVEGGMYYFDPNEIRVKAGEKVTITFINVEGIHDFVIDELGVKTKQISEGETDMIEFTPEHPGTYEFYCSVGNHRVMGMRGTLVVE